MADEVFALSPISARAAQPNEEDYAAIHEAFMETSRGRWFLGEYAKRNRNADTRLVLDAVVRIEQSIAAQKKAAAEAELNEAVAAIRSAVTAAQAVANAGLDGLAFDERLAPIGKGVRIIREISWRWREIGTDGRICDILDSQVAAIENSAGQITVTEARAAIDHAFGAIEARLNELTRGADAPAQARRDDEDANVVPFPAPAEEATELETAAADEIAAAEPVAEAPEAKVAERIMATAVEPVAEAAAPIADVVGAIEVVDEAAADAHDEAMLDLIAAEMSAPDPMENEFVVEETAIAEPQPVEPAPVEAKAIAPEPIVTRVAPPVQPEPPAAVAPAPAPTRIGEAEASIGSAVIASGILRKPNLPNNDALAPIRRMSPAEKIAFFS
jgi:hypothetical protein